MNESMRTQSMSATTLTSCIPYRRRGCRDFLCKTDGYR